MEKVNNFRIKYECKKAIVKHKGDEYLILIPIYDFKYTYINELNKNDFYFFSAKEDFSELSKAFYMIAERQKTILYIPFLNNNVPLFLQSMPADTIGLDLVCIDHTLQLKQKEWKNIRRKITNQSLVKHNLQINVSHYWHKEWWNFNYKENKDIIDLYSNFSTLILTGSRETFNFMGYEAMNLSEYEYDKSGLAHSHLSHLFKSSWKNREWREITFFLIEPDAFSERIK